MCIILGFSGDSDGKNNLTIQETQFQSQVWEETLGRKWQPPPLLLPGEFHPDRGAWHCMELQRVAHD